VHTARLIVGRLQAPSALFNKGRALCCWGWPRAQVEASTIVSSLLRREVQVPVTSAKDAAVRVVGCKVAIRSGTFQHDGCR